MALIGGTIFLTSGTYLEAASFSWVSPGKHFTATYAVDPGSDSSSFKITDMETSPPTNLMEGGGSAPALWALSPAVAGFWSSDEKTLFLMSVQKTEMNYLQVYGDVWRFSPTAEGSHDPYPHFEDIQQQYPDALNGEVGDKLLTLDPKLPFLLFGLNGTVACRWKSPNLLELDNQQMIQTSSSDRKSSRDYLAQWTTESEVGASGFKTVGMSPIRYAPLDAKGKPGQWKEFPQTDQDRLRIAIRAGEQEETARLLAKGVNPNADSVASLPAIACESNQAAILDLLIKAGADINRSKPPRPAPLVFAVAATDPAILDKLLEAHPRPSVADSALAYRIAIGGMAEEAQGGPRDISEPVVHRLEALAKAGIDINAPDPASGQTPLILAVRFFAPPSFVKKMLALGANPALRGKDGQSAIDIARTTKQTASLQQLDPTHSPANTSPLIPANSPFIGTWQKSDHMLMITLRADGSGALSTLFPGVITWKVVNGIAKMEINLPGANRPGVAFYATGQMDNDGRALRFICKELTGSNAELLEKAEQPHP
jgi:ankyrin repeat protein